MKNNAVLLPWPPSINHYYGRGRYGRMYIKPEGQAFRSRVALALWDCPAGYSKQFERVDGKIQMKVVLFPPDNRARDIDNTMKALLDALQHAGAYENDRLIRKLTIEFDEPCKPGHVAVEIKAYRRRRS